MPKLKLGELCAGYGGLGLAVEEALGAELAWYSEFDAAPSKIMATHWPEIPNHGDMTLIDWSAVEPVDIISGGTPCQDLSAAGRRKGMTEGTRSNLWVNMREAIATIQPTYVVWENVRGAYSAKAASDLEHCAGCMGSGGRSDEHVLRALGRVLGDLADLGYDTQWRGLRAADVGAPHGRFRVFILATRRGSEHPHGSDGGRRSDAGGASGGAKEVQGCPGTSANADDFGLEGIGSSGLGTELASVAGGGPASRNASVRGWDDARPAGSEEHQERERSGAAGRPSEPVVAIAESFRGSEGWPEHARVEGRLDAVERGASTDWGDYAPAIHRWEAVRGTAPAPTELTAKGKHRLSARFAEWMMGVDPGWVTDVDISRNEQLKAIGNGVVPQQAVAALRDMLGANHAS